VAGAASIARNLGGWRQGENWRCPCPLDCGYTLSLRDGDDGRLLAYCFGGCEFHRVLTVLIEYGLLDDGEVDDGSGAVSYSPLSFTYRGVNEPLRENAARWIYDHLAPAAGTIVETYLRSRRIDRVPSILRFGQCPHRLGGSYPAMVAPVVNINGELTGIHATFLNPNGRGKADFGHPEFQRECRGVIRGRAIRLAEHAPDRELIIGEGVETVLSAMEIFGLPGWSAIYAGGLKTIELPPVVRHIVIAADNDASLTGQRNALTAYERWRSEGRSVCIKCPPVVGNDFNDVLFGRKSG
jgi:hypothetical protein